MDDSENLKRYPQPMNTNNKQNEEDKSIIRASGNKMQDSDPNTIDQRRKHVMFIGKYAMYDEYFRNEKNTKKFADVVSSGRSHIHDDTNDDKALFVLEESKKMQSIENQQQQDTNIITTDHHDTNPNSHPQKKRKRLSNDHDSNTHTTTKNATRAKSIFRGNDRIYEEDDIDYIYRSGSAQPSPFPSMMSNNGEYYDSKLSDYWCHYEKFIIIVTYCQ